MRIAYAFEVISFFSGYYACCVVYVLCITQVLVWRAFGMAIIQWIALIMRPWLFPLISLEILIGLLMRVLHAHPLVFWFAIGSSFFYTVRIRLELGDLELSMDVKEPPAWFLIVCSVDFPVMLFFPQNTVTTKNHRLVYDEPPDVYRGCSH